MDDMYFRNSIDFAPQYKVDQKPQYRNIGCDIGHKLIPLKRI